MNITIPISQFKFILSILLLASLVFFMGACATKTTTEDSSTVLGEQSKAADSKINEQEGGENSSARVTSDTSPDVQVAQIDANKDDISNVADIVAAPKIVEECKQEPYVKYEQQSRESIKKGMQATKAERFGVGFRNAGEYKKWSTAHNEVFKSVSEACMALSDCAKKNAKDKEKQCASQATKYNDWQKLAKRFADKIKAVESTQPPPLCALTPDKNDPSDCFNLLADNINKTCQSEQCQEASLCFRGVYFLDDAIRQAEHACGFVGQKLSECRGYVEASGRRSNELNQCLDMYKNLDAEILPVI
ncbi:hypothetical protein [Kaarinaea lacus]